MSVTADGMRFVTSDPGPENDVITYERTNPNSVLSFGAVAFIPGDSLGPSSEWGMANELLRCVA